MGTNELTTILRSVLPKEHLMSTGDWIAIVAALAAIALAIIALLALVDARRSAAAAELSADASKKTAEYAKQANILAEGIAKRAGVIELHSAWKGIARFDPKKPIFPDAINAANALDLTSSLWNHDVLEKEILFQSYWKSFKEFYRVLSSCDLQLPDDYRRVCDLVSESVKRAHDEMQEREQKNVPQTKITGGK